MIVEEANHLGPGDWLRVTAKGLKRHGIEGIDAEGTYVTQFESPKNGRLIVVRIVGHGAFGFRLDEVELLRRRRDATRQRLSSD